MRQYVFSPGLSLCTRAGEHARRFLPGWKGQLICDDFNGYKALFASGVTEVGCLAHARCKFFDLWVNHKSPVAEEALRFFTAIYDIDARPLELVVRRIAARRSTCCGCYEPHPVGETERA